VSDFTVNIWAIVPEDSVYICSQAHDLAPYSSDFIIGLNGVTSSIFWMRTESIDGLDAYNDGKPHMFTLVWDLTVKKFKGYVDGVYLGQSVTVSGYGAAGNIVIGSRGDRSDAFSAGINYGLTTWTRTLDATEISALYSGSTPSGATHAQTGIGNNPWKDTIGTNHGTESGTFERLMAPESDSNDQIDAYGTAIQTPRPNAYAMNLFGDGEYANCGNDSSLDVTTEATWEIWGNFYGVPSATGAIFGKYDSSQNKLSIIVSKHIADAADQVRLITSSSGTNSAASYIENIPDKFACLTLTLGASGWKAYVDGVQTTMTGDSPLFPLYINDIDLEVGTNTAASIPLSGIEGSFKIYPYEFTAEQVIENCESQQSKWS
jgi:hypothetical protein